MYLTPSLINHYFETSLISNLMYEQIYEQNNVFGNYLDRFHSISTRQGELKYIYDGVQGLCIICMSWGSYVYSAKN